MERGPIPPHERTWRHPSELAAEERAAVRAEAAAPSTRFVALTTGTLGLLAVGILILTVTPARQDAPIAISATTIPRSDAPSERSTVSAGFAARGTASPRPAVEGVDEPVTVEAIATPIADGRLALTTRASIARGHRGAVVVRLPSGRVGSADIVAMIDDAVVVALDRAEPGPEIAERRPRDHEMVTIMASPPVTVAFADLGAIDVDEGTAVLDQSGALVGLCSEHDDAGIRLVAITKEIAGATSADR